MCSLQTYCLHLLPLNNIAENIQCIDDSYPQYIASSTIHLRNTDIMILWDTMNGRPIVWYYEILWMVDYIIYDEK